MEIICSGHFFGNSASKMVEVFILSVTLRWVTLPPVVVHRLVKVATQIAFVQPNILPNPIF